MLLSVLFPDDLLRKNRVVTVLYGYFDDSRHGDTRDPQSVAVAGGIVAHPDAWEGFSARWKEVLRDYEVEIHHQNRWSNQAKPFDRETWRFWPQREDYLNELLSLITGVEGAVSIAGGVPVERFQRLCPTGSKYISPFGYAVQVVLGAAVESARKTVPDAEIAYVFESGTEGFGEVQKTFDEHLRWPAIKDDFGLVSLTTANKRRFMQLQAADIVAYETYKLIKDGDTLETVNLRHPLKVLMRHLPDSVMTTPDDTMLQRTNAHFELWERFS